MAVLYRHTHCVTDLEVHQQGTSKGVSFYHIMEIP